MRILLTIIFLALGIINIFLFQDWYHWGVDNDVSWTLSSFLGWIIAFVCALAVLIIVVKSKIQKAAVKWSVALIMFIGILIGTFAVNPIYSADYKKESIVLEKPNHALATQITEQIENFEGLVLIARPGCPFCKEAIDNRLVELERRNENIQIAVYLAKGIEKDLDKYKSDKTKNIAFFVKDREFGDNDALTITGYPTFVYVKDGGLIHQWSNDDFGYRSLDWIENQLQ
jgi:hypothetical protein